MVQHFVVHTINKEKYYADDVRPRQGNLQNETDEDR